MTTFQKLVSSVAASKVIAPEIDYLDYVSLDLSISNQELQHHPLETALDYQLFIQKYLDNSNSKIAFGGYNEIRNLYKRSTVFNNQTVEERNIHIGLDLWINEQATIHAALDGEIHSFQNNTALGDYGPTIILKHEIEGFIFHTLYGHLSEESLENKTIGAKIKKGEQIATLGLPPINGDYAPHLHFQIIVDMENKFGDYPGVSSKNNLSFYLENCPNPEILLRIKN
jgi:murein DD-endopeptidase MepM/ murein hydrolase activator NlpD